MAHRPKIKKEFQKAESLGRVFEFRRIGSPTSTEEREDRSRNLAIFLVSRVSGRLANSDVSFGEKPYSLKLMAGFNWDRPAMRATGSYKLAPISQGVPKVAGDGRLG